MSENFLADGRKDVAPLRGESVGQRPWEGRLRPRPWEHRVTAVVPVLDTPHLLPYCLDLLLLQTERPYVMVIDTGSRPEYLERVVSLGGDRVEVHCLAAHGVRHPSEPISQAMDCAFSLCRTELLFCTHVDCFLRDVSFLRNIADKCTRLCPVVGYEMSPRQNPDWRGMVSHTATMCHMPSMRAMKVSWSIPRTFERMGCASYHDGPVGTGWPDTEVEFNYCLRDLACRPMLIGKESNEARHVDANLDHFRSYTCSMLYSPGHHAAVRVWADEAVREAKSRIRDWVQWYRRPEAPRSDMPRLRSGV